MLYGERAEQAKFSNQIKFSILFVVVGIIFFRNPILFTEPRFWAEEGSVYFSSAFHSTWIVSLFQPHLGYLSLIPNIATIIAAKFV